MSRRQLGLFRRVPNAASIGNPYVPILLAKRGERIALEQINSEWWSAITPWFRIVPPELRSGGVDDAAPAAEMARVAAAAGDRAIYLDAVGTPRRRRRITPLPGSYMQEVYESAVASNLAFLPVYPFGRPELGELVRNYAGEVGAAVLLPAAAALAYGSRRLTDDLRTEVTVLGVDPRRLDLMLDIGYIPPGTNEPDSVIRFALQAIAAAGWRSVILAGTSVPDSLSGEIPDNSLDSIPRREVPLFASVQAHLAVRLRFADYGVQNPLPPAPAAVPKMRANIRYTAGEVMWVSRGRPMDELRWDEVPDHYQEIATRICRHPPFAGVDCCWGDEFIEALADGRRHARSQYWMRAVATCHHIRVVAQERIVRRPAAAARAKSRQPADQVPVGRRDRRPAGADR